MTRLMRTMLEGESIFVGDAEICIEKVTGPGWVKVVFTAPPEVQIRRPTVPPVSSALERSKEGPARDR